MSECKSVAGIYARKSLYTVKGESIQNQVNMCSDFAAARGWDIKVYTDEGYSGSNTHRPGFQKMLIDIEHGNLSTVIFYRLDRVSRRILDICEFIEQLNDKNIGFISITENFDTTSPIGRAMVHIAATFAQLEREMLAQRIRDNMIQLAKTGRWLGGTTPTGYISKKVVYYNEDMRKKHIYVLEEKSEELETVKEIFKKYLEYKSLTMVEAYCSEKGIKSKNNKTFSKVTIKNMLTNPVYIIADKNTYEYFNALDVQIANNIEDFNGINGLLTYNKNIEKKGQTNKLREKKEWIMAIGSHKGIIGFDDWLHVQEILNDRKYSSSRLNSSPNMLLSGILSCGKCGSQMYVKYGSLNASKRQRQSYYVCSSKAAYSSTKCTNSNIRTDILDDVVCKILCSSFSDRKILFEKLKAYADGYYKKTCLNGDKGSLAIYLQRLDNLIQQLETTDPLSPSALIIKEKIDSIYITIEKLKSEVNKDDKAIDMHKVDFNYLISILSDFKHVFLNSKDINSKKIFIKEVISKIIWNDGKLIVKLK